MKELATILLLMIALSGAFLVGRCSAPDHSYNNGKAISDSVAGIIVSGRKIDTVVTETVKYRPQIVYRDVAKIVYMPIDTLLEVQPFVASADTVLNSCDTLSLAYEYPANILSWKLKQCPDTLIARNIYEQVFQTKIIERPLWQDILSHTGVGLAVGLIVWGLK